MNKKDSRFNQQKMQISHRKNGNFSKYITIMNIINNNNFQRKIVILLFLLGLILLTIFREHDFFNLWTRFTSKPAFGRDFSAYHAGAVALSEKRSDLIYNNQSLEQWLKKGNMNNWLPGEYPPFVDFLFLPLAKYPLYKAIKIQLLMNLIFLISSISILIFCFLKKFKLWQKYLLLFLFIPITLFFSPVIDCLFSGQFTALLFLLITLFSVYYVNDKIIPAAFFLGIAISLKLYPAFFLIYFLIKKDYKSLFWTSLFTIFLNVLVIIYTFNMNFYLEYFKTFSQISKIAGYYANQSLLSFINSLILNNNNVSTPYVKTISNLVILIIFCLMAYFTLRFSSKTGKNKECICLEISSVILFILLILPRSWPHYHIFIIISLFLIYSVIDDSLKNYFLYFILFVLLFFVIGLFDGEVASRKADILFRCFLFINYFFSYVLLLLWLLNIIIMKKWMDLSNNEESGNKVHN